MWKVAKDRVNHCMTIRLQVFLLCSVMAGQSGCISLGSMMGAKRGPTFDTTMLKAQGYSIPPGGMPRQLPSTVIQDGTGVVLEIRDDEPRLAAIPLPQGRTVTVEDFAKQLEISKTLGSCTLHIMRPNGDTPPVRLDVHLNSKGRVSNPANNYALRPGDHIIAISDGRNMLERFIDEQFGKG
jgi:hypothetical protein